MDLTHEQIADFRAHLTHLGARETCPVCDRNAWRYGADSLTIHRECGACGLNQSFRAHACFSVTPWEQAVEVIAADILNRWDRRWGDEPKDAALRGNAEMLLSFYHSVEAFRRAQLAPLTIGGVTTLEPLRVATTRAELRDHAGRVDGP